MTKKEISKVAMYSIAMLQDMYVARGDSYEEAFANALEDVDISESEYKEIQKCFVGKRGTKQCWNRSVKMTLKEGKC